MKHLILLVFCCVVACKVPKNVVKEEGSSANPITVDASYVPKTTDRFEIDSAAVEKDNLRLFIHYGGGCENHLFKGYSNGVYKKSLPPKIGLFIEHEANQDKCKAIVADTVDFDLKALRAPGKDKDYVIVLELDGYKKELRYEY